MIMPANVADMMPSGMERRGCARSPERPTPAVIPVNAGKTMAKTSMKGSGSARSEKTLTDSGRISSGPAPRKNIASESPRILATTQSAFTPRSAPFRSTTETRITVAGSDTILGSKGIPVRASKSGASGRTASAKAIM